MDKQKSRAALDQLFRDLAGAMTAGMIYTGTRTGLFRAMAGKGPLAAAEVARAAGLQPRYVEEWLKGMVSAGYLAYDPEAQSYALAEEHAHFLASDGSDHFVGGLFDMVPPLLRAAPQVARAFAEGGGVPFESFGPDCVSALELINSGQYEQRFADWLAHVPAAAERLRDGGRALDVGCGSGRVCIALAKAFPRAQIGGIDPHPGSIERARAAAAAAGVAARIELRALAASALEPDGPGYDLIALCDVLHDLADPLPALTRLRERLAPEGVLFVVEPKAADRLEDNRNAVATTFYGFSLFHCMTQSLARGGPGLGTCLGPSATLALLREAGFTRCQPLEIRSLTNLFYAAQR